MSADPKPGEVYERDGRQRIVVAVEKHPGNIRWKATERGTVRECWCGTWQDWVAHATRVKEAPNDPAERT